MEDQLSTKENISLVDISKEASKQDSETPSGKSKGRLKLESWLNACMKIEMTDGRTLIGQFLCTDRDCNIILGSCYEYAPYSGSENSTFNYSTTLQYLLHDREHSG